MSDSVRVRLSLSGGYVVSTGLPSEVVTSTAPTTAPHDHAVSFYDLDTEVVAEVARYVAEGLSLGERVVVIATAGHRAAIDEAMLQHGMDAGRARTLGRYVTLDAAETLARFMVAGSPDPVGFEAVIGQVIDAAGEGGCRVRAFGEMVALLWNEGNVAATLRLESLWNDLARDRKFLLLCAYAHHAVQQAALEDVHHVCTLHSDVAAPRSYFSVERASERAGAHRVSDVFLPVIAAVPAVRRFVTAVLRAWDLDELVADGSVVATELATNAVSHSASPFSASITRSESTLRIAIEDVSSSVPHLVHAASDAFGGRGIAIVAELATSWGCSETASGKLVWADLSLPLPRTA
jgi:hypothetical protein